LSDFVVYADLGTVASVDALGDAQARITALELPALFRREVALVDANRIFAERDDMPVVQLPVHIVQRTAECEHFQSGKGQDGPRTIERENDGGAQRRDRQGQEYEQVGPPCGGLVGLGDDHESRVCAVAGDQKCAFVAA